MSNEITIDFGTLTLDSGDFTVSGIKTKEKKSVKEHRIPKADHSIAETARRTSLVITVEGNVVGTDYDDLRTNIDTLRAGLEDGEQKFTLDDDRYIMAQLKDFDYSYNTIRRFAKWRAVFLASYPFWLSESESTDDRTPTSGVEYNITNNGNAPARCKIEITAPVSPSGLNDDCNFSNVTTGEGFAYRGNILGGNVLEIDNRYDGGDFEVLNNASDDHENYEGSFITLDPGVNAIKFIGGAGAAVKIYWRDTYY